MMKRLRLLLTFFLLATLTVLSAQPENDPCSAPCLGASGSVSGTNPSADGQMPNANLPCGSGTSEDNPTWYTFVAGCSSFTLNVSVSGCASGSSIQATIFEGDGCGDISAASCVNCVTGGAVSIATVPGKQYWIQVDGCAEAVCNFALSYDPNCLLKNIPKPLITGLLNVCKGSTQDYCATIPGGIVPSSYTWNIVPASAGQIIPNDLCTQVKWNQTGTFQLCATPKFNVKCPPTGVQKGCVTVVVTEFKEAICTQTLCPEQVPFEYKLMPCIQSANPNVTGTPDPDITVLTGAPGTSKVTNINYIMDPSGCAGKIKLTTIIKAKATKTLPPMLICEDDSVKVGTSWLKCADAKPGIQNYIVASAESVKPVACDTTYNFILQCIKINPIVTPANPSLDCINTSVTIKAGNSVFLPTSNAANPGVKSYLWSNGATTPEITVTSKGVYCVTISYEYTLTTSAGTVTKKCSKVKCITVTGSGTTPEAPTPIAINPYPCLNDTASYTVSVNTGTTYDWTITGGTPATFTGNIIKVQWGNTPPYKVCAVAKNVCGNSPPGCINITLNEGPKQPVITGPTPICAGDTMTTYSTPKLTTPNPTYTWTLPTGASFVGKIDSNVINVKWAGNATSGPITLVVSDKCGVSPKATLNVVINQLPAAPTGIDGDLDVCKNDKIDYTVNPTVPFAMDYNWTVKGGTITSSTAGLDTKTITVMWTKVANDNQVCVSAVNNCDTIGKKFCITVSTKDFPQPTAGSDKSVCGLKIKLNGSKPGAGNTGKWTQLSGVGTSTFDDDTKEKAEVSVTKCGEYKFVWTETNSAGCAGKDTVMVSFSEKPTISNPVVTCDPVAKTYKATLNVVGCIAPYIVTLNNIAGSTPQTLTTAPFTFTTPDIPQTTKFVEYAVQSGSCTSNFIDTVDCNCVTRAGEMDLQATQTACSSGGGTVKAIHKTGTETTDNDDVTAYILYEGTATTLTNGIVMNKTGVFSFNPTTMQCGKTYYIGFLVGNNDGTGFPSAADQCLKLTPVNQEVKWDCVPKPNAGTDNEVCGLSYILKAATPAAGVTGVWSSKNGATFTPSNSPTATVTIPDPAGTYKFFWTETNGKCKDSASVNITFKDSDIQTSTEKYTCDAQNENYTVKFDISGGKAPYFVLDCTTNAVIATLSNAPYTFNSAAFASGSSFCFKIADSNGCDTVTLNKSYACGCATQLGSFNLTNEVCVGTDLKAVRAQNDAFDGNDTWEFILATGNNPKDPAFPAGILARNQTGIFSFDPATMQCDKTYKLVYVVGNKTSTGTGVKFDDPCLSASSKDVKFICVPSTVSSIVKVDTCAKQVTLNSTGKKGTWAVLPNVGISFVDNTDPKTTANGITWGTYTFTWTEDNNGCTAASDALLNLVSPSNLTYKNNVVCESTNKSYTLSVDLTGAAPFSIDQISTNATGNLVGSVFTSDPIESGKKVTLSFKDAVSCIPTTYDFDHTCPCDSKAGTMNPTQLKLCQGTDAEVSAPPASGVVLDGDDTFEFVLHESATTTLASIKGRNKTGKFKFDAATMQYGKLYYISYIVGDNKAGQVDLNYFCKDIAKGTPVVWNENPTLVAAKDATICKGGSSEITLTMTGKADFEIYYNANGPQTPLISKNNTTVVPVNPTETTAWNFTKVIDANGCFVDLNKKITITVNEPAKSGFPSPDRRLCFGQDQTIDMNTEVTGGDAGGTWSVSPATNFVPATGIFKTKSTAPGTYTFTYTVKGKAPCPDASTSVKVTIDAIPNADAGFDKELNCDNTEITLGGNSTSGPSITYTWTSIDGTALSNEKVKNPTVKAAGRFILQVRDSLSSCFAYDTCVVKKDISKIDSVAYKVIQPNCFGDDNGSFLISNVSGGTPPYQFSLNNGPFTPYKNFSNLKAGSYFVKMKDSKGCPFQDSVIVDQPYEIDVELGALYPPDNNNNEKDYLNLGEAADLEAVINFLPTELKKLIWYPQCDSCKTLDLIVKPQETTLYAVTVINNKGCIAKDNVLVQVKKPRNVYIPNIFHPDSDKDGNRKLRVYLGLDVAKVHYFRIYDRWGDVIHEDLEFTRDQVYQQDKGWDGSFRKERAQPGVYSYSCKVEFVDGYIEIYKGDVLMILKD